MQTNGLYSFLFFVTLYNLNLLRRILRDNCRRTTKNTTVPQSTNTTVILKKVLYYGSCEVSALLARMPIVHFLCA